MSSFKRKNPSTPQTLPKGTKPSPALSSLLLTSSGIPSFDDILGGGVQLGTNFLVLNPDPHSAHTDLLQKYFISQGLSSDQQVHVFAPDARNLVNSCMWVPGTSATSVPDDEDAVNDNEGKVKIAWRYEHMQKFRTTVYSQDSDNEDYCRPVDLSCRIPPEAVAAFLSAGLLHIEDTVFESSEEVYDSVIRRIENIAKDSDASNKQNVVRLSIPAFASPEWGEANPQIVLRFLLRLRAVLRRCHSISAFITLPAHLSSDTWAGEGWIEKLAWVSDACITLNSSTADPATAALFASSHGLLRIHKLPCVQTLVPASDRFSSLRGLAVASSSISSSGVGENNLSFKCTRKRFIIETLHLDIDGGVGERRTTPAPSAIAIQEGTAQKMASQHHTNDGHDEHESRVMIEMETKHGTIGNLESRRSDTDLTPSGETQETGTVKKKPKKRVGFQVERPDIFDF
ncbi:PAXNEB-domain-containing protein [Fomitiporia mediterranea MF3/22]|uniref:PAXNEB-domain-containing protein n=1 Tax=Fomitiporia mediterranea (strain MF3/22) TaxID=694068 RepID=UPI000440866F|nr:PAXNEB-domain-containing protein [Fomitiporia mediterranea MF3/22]EJD03898.1 PAXNEB-domain-containing protein [Fomitiporia mediterranea MF3/22]